MTTTQEFTPTAPCRTGHVGACQQVMTVPNLIATMEHHGVRTRKVDTVAGPIVEVWEEATVNGEDASAWIVAPRTIHDVAVWLGY